jgi:hypothetical protein
MFTTLPAGDELTIVAFFAAAGVGAMLAAAQERDWGGRRWFFVTISFCFFLCGLFWPTIKLVSPEINAAAISLAHNALFHIIFGIIIGLFAGSLLTRKRLSRCASSPQAQEASTDFVLIDFDANNSTGYYWIDKKSGTTKAKAIDTTNEILATRYYYVKIVNNTGRVLPEVRAFSCKPGRPPDELPFSFSTHANRTIHIGAIDYIEVASCPVDFDAHSGFSVALSGEFDLLINCPGYRQIKRHLSFNSRREPPILLTG